MAQAYKLLDQWKAEFVDTRIHRDFLVMHPWQGRWHAAPQLCVVRLRRSDEKEITPGLEQLDGKILWFASLESNPQTFKPEDVFWSSCDSRYPPDAPVFLSGREIRFCLDYAIQANPLHVG